MQDIRRPYTRSRSSNDLQSRVEQFEAARYKDEEEPVRIPVKRTRRDIDSMDMYPRKRHDEDYYDDEEDQRERVSDVRPPSYRDTKARYERRRASYSTLLSVLGIFLLVVGVALYTYVFNKATITIVPKYKDITDLGRVFPFVKEGETGTGVPFTVTTTSLSKSRTLAVSESRKVEAKASGKIIIYNNYDGSVQKLIKNTRFLSSKGKIYRINQSVDVPGKVGDTPGSVEVTVYADSNGSDYNSEATEFTIPGFKGTPRETAFYAKSSGPLTGGSSGTMSLVSLSDLNAAKDSLILELDKEVKAEADKIKKDGYIPMYSAITITYEDNQDEVLKGISTTYTLTATAHLMLANAPKLAEAVAKTLGDYANEPVRLGFTDSLTFTKKDSDNIASTTALSILVEGQPRVIWVSDISSIKDMVKGKSRDDFKPLMKTINSIESAEISFSPLWLSKFPSDAEKVIVVESLPKR